MGASCNDDVDLKFLRWCDSNRLPLLFHHSNSLDKFLYELLMKGSESSVNL